MNARTLSTDAGFLGIWKKPSFLITAGIVVLLLIALGLWLNRSGSDRVQVYPARGQAFLDGKPIAAASIHLDPVWTKAPNFPRPRAIAEADGSFALETYGEDDGAPAGEYRVSVQLFV